VEVCVLTVNEVELLVEPAATGARATPRNASFAGAVAIVVTALKVPDPVALISTMRLPLVNEVVP
jgi:hypothetical protein